MIKPGETDRPGDLRLGGEGADGEPHEQHGSDAERKSPQIDLADQVAETDGEKYRKDRLGGDDLTSQIEHDDLQREL